MPMWSTVAGRRWSIALLAALALALHWNVSAQEAGEAQAAGLAFMARLQHAARHQDYSGVFIYQQGSVMLSSQIVHMTDETGEHQRVEILDGRTHREFLRHNREVLSLFPEARVVLVESRETEHFPSFFVGQPQELARHYAIELVPDPGRVAGHQCQIAHLVPRDTLRWGYRVCADLETGLLLKVQTVNPEGVVLEQVAFSEVQLGQRVDPERLKPNHDVSDWKRMHTGQAIDLVAAGWHIPAPAGFAPISQVQRTLKHSKNVRQMVLSDGLAAISVFIENRQPERQAAPGAAEQGATSVYRREYGEYWLTVLGEVPAQTVRSVAETIRYDGGADPGN